MKRILVPTDFSNHAEYALKVAAQIAKKNDGEIFLIHMLELPTAGADALSRSHEMPELMLFKNIALKVLFFIYANKIGASKQKLTLKRYKKQETELYKIAFFSSVAIIEVSE